MSQLIDYQHLRPQEAHAEKELDGLLTALSEHGVLRLLTDLTRALPHVGLIAARGLNGPESVSVARNLVTLLQALGRVPPESFAHFLDALSASARGIEREAADPQSRDGQPPGITGAYHLLQDNALWQALGPILDGLKAFGYTLRTAEPPPKTPSRGPLL